MVMGVSFREDTLRSWASVLVVADALLLLTSFGTMDWCSCWTVFELLSE